MCLVSSNPCSVGSHGNDSSQQPTYLANVRNFNKIKDREEYVNGEKATRLFFQHIDSIRQPSGKRNTVFVLDADRKNIWRAPRKSVFCIPEKFFRQGYEDKGYTVIDMNNLFKAHFDLNKKKFDYPSDSHWNEIGHEIVAKSIAEALNFKK